MKKKNGLLNIIENMTEEDAEILWKYSGPEGPFPGRDCAIFYMVQGVTRAALKSLGKFFAGLAPHSGVIAVAALLRVVLPGSQELAGRIGVQAPEVQALRHQLQRETSAPTRGSPWTSRVGEAPT